MRNLLKYLPVTLLLAGAFACADEETPRNNDAAYFPLKHGLYQVYAVEEIVYPRLGAAPEIDTYELKTQVVDSFPNQEGGYTYTMHRSRRNTSADAWVFQNLWSVRLTATRVVVSEENNPVVKLVFPTSLNRQWNPNMFNTAQAEQYTVQTKGTGYQIPGGGHVEGNYVTVSQHDYEDAYNIDKREEVYVQNIGLVYRKGTVIEYCSNATFCDITQQVIDHGTVYVYRLIDYGQE